MYFCSQYSSPVGRLTLASGGDSLSGLWLEGQKYFGGALGPLEEREDLPVFDLTRSWLDRYFAGARPDPAELPLAPVGSPFRQEVWKLLLRIPYGKVTTYGALSRELAHSLGREHMSAQAVGGAVGHNPISIIIPCHRVVGADGSLTGYAGGVETKRGLLELEGADLTSLYLPARGTAL